MKVTAVLLAAGLGIRMKSNLPKVLHPICGKPMLWHVLEALKESAGEKPVVVVGHGAEAVRTYLGDSAECILQEPQQGGRRGEYPHREDRAGASRSCTFFAERPKSF